MACVDSNEIDSPELHTTEPLNRLILELAGSLALQEHSEFHIVHAWEAFSEDIYRSLRNR